MRLFLYLVKWMHGSFALFSFKEAVIPSKMYTMLQILIGIGLQFLFYHTDLIQFFFLPFNMVTTASIGLSLLETQSLLKMRLLALNLPTYERSTLFPFLYLVAEMLMLVVILQLCLKF